MTSQGERSGRYRGARPPRPLIAFMRSRFLLPAVVAMIQVSGSIHERTHDPAAEPVDGVALTLLVAGPVALTVRRWWPREVLLLALVTTVAYHFLDYPEGPISLSLVVAFIAVFFRGHRTFAWVMLVITYFSLFWLGYVVGLEPRPELDRALGAAAWMLALFAFFEVGRGRRERVREAARVRREETKRRASEERLRIARELHDVLGHNLSLINVQAGTALHLLDERPEQAQIALSAIKDTSNDALRDLRSVLDVLREGGEEAPRAPLPTLADVDDLVRRTRLTGLDVTKEISGRPRPLPANLERSAFRIVQEALTNVTRHAEAGTAIVRIDYRKDDVVIEVADDGRGADAVEEGNGIAGMRERAGALGGELEVEIPASGGFIVRARLPLREETR